MFGLCGWVGRVIWVWRRRPQIVTNSWSWGVRQPSAQPAKLLAEIMAELQEAPSTDTCEAHGVSRTAPAMLFQNLDTLPKKNKLILCSDTACHSACWSTSLNLHEVLRIDRRERRSLGTSCEANAAGLWLQERLACLACRRSWP